MVLLAVLTALPSLTAGFLGDDWVHRAMLLHRPPFDSAESWRDLFRFLQPGQTTDLMESRGLLSWWADPQVHAAFFRPLTVLTHLVDYQLWPDVPLLHHLHSLVWAAAMVVLAVPLFRSQSTSAVAAAVAVLLVSIEDAHVVPIAWLANRNALITAVFGILSLRAYLAWRERGDGRYWGASLLALGAALLAGEAGLATVAWMAAHALIHERSWRARAVALAGPLVLVVVWRVVYTWMGYGAHSSGLYIDPGATPGQWGLTMVTRLPLLVAGQLLPLPLDVWAVLPGPAQRATAAVCGLAVVALVLLVWPVLRARVAARTYALAILLVLVPFTATFPMDRLLTLSSLAAAGLIGEVVDHYDLLSGVWPSLGRMRLAFLGLVLLWNGPASLVLRPLRMAATPAMGLVFDLAANTAPTDPALADQTLVFVHANDFSAIYSYVKRIASDDYGPAPAAIGLMSTWWTDVTIVREDERTLVLTPEGGFLGRSVDHLLRDPRLSPFAPGDVLHHRAFDVEVRSVTEDGRPAVVAFAFPAPLESPAAGRLVTLTRDGVVPFAPPAVGSSLTLRSVLKPARAQGRE